MMDIAIALLVALLFEMLSILGRHFKRIAILTSCVTFIAVYYISGWEIDFKGEMDVTIWVLCVVTFDTLLATVIDKFSNHIKG